MSSNTKYLPQQQQQSPEYYSKSSGSSTSSNSSLSSTNSLNQQSPTNNNQLYPSMNFAKSPVYFNATSSLLDNAVSSTTIRNKRSFNECEDENYDYQKQATKYHCSNSANLLTKTSPLNTITYQNQYYSANNYNYNNQVDYTNVIASVQPTSRAFNV